MEKCSIIQLMHRKKYKLLISRLVIKNSYVLDIGFGFGYLKPLVENLGANYLGIDPRTDGAVEYAKKTYGKKGFIHGYFPEANTLTKEELYNGLIISLTTMDEVVDQSFFLQEINKLCSEETKVYITVRNSDWYFFRKKELKTVDGVKIFDYSVEDYKKKFKENGFDILSIEKSSRPILTSFTFNGFKTLIIVLLDIILPTQRSYMLGFLLRKTDVIEKNRLVKI